MSASQQAAAIPMEALKFSASFSDKLTGGARSLPSQSKAGNAKVVDADDEGDAGPLVSSFNGHSSGLTEVPPYDPLVIHKTEPWRRALVNDDSFDLKSKVFFFRPLFPSSGMCTRGPPWLLSLRVRTRREKKKWHMSHMCEE